MKHPKRTHRLTFSHRHSSEDRKRRVYYVDALPSAYGSSNPSEDAKRFAVRCIDGINMMYRSILCANPARLHRFFDTWIVIVE